jgi:hypothetical protein
MSGGAGATVASSARAEATDPSLAAALKRFESGRKAFDAGRYDEALGEFQASLELLSSPNTRMYIGRCYRGLGRTASAFTELRLAAHEAHDRLNASGDKRYAATSEAADAEAAQLEPVVPRLTVTVPGDPPSGFAIKVNGRDLPRAAWGTASETDPGAVSVEADGPRLVPFRTTVLLSSGAQERVDIALVRIPTAGLTVRLDNLPAGIAMILDGLPVDLRGPLTTRELDVGPHSIVVSAPGYAPFRWSETLADREEGLVAVTLEPAQQSPGGHAGTPKWAFFTVAAATLGTLGVATGIAVHASSENDGQLGLSPYARDPGIKSSIQSQATAADVLFVGGAVLGAASVALVVTTRWRTAAGESSVSILPWADATGAGIGARGGF